MMKKSIYKSENSKKETLALYDRQIADLGCEFEDLYVTTTFGRTHIIKAGNYKGIPLVVLHGGNSTTAYNLKMVSFLLKDFCVYAIDIMGHPGKSDEHCLPSYGYSYGKWLSECIEQLGLKKVRCYGNSFGAGVIAKYLCVSPEQVVRCVLEVPSGIHNAIPLRTMQMLGPLMKYRKTKEEKYIVETALFMSITRDVIGPDTMDILRDSFDHVNTKTMMPTNISKGKLKEYEGMTLVIAGEKDCLFPAKKVLKRASEIFKNVEIYELKNRGHMHILAENEEKMIIDFLKK